jgi:hypothetical protein
MTAAIWKTCYDKLQREMNLGTWQGKESYARGNLEPRPGQRTTDFHIQCTYFVAGVNSVFPSVKYHLYFSSYGVDDRDFGSDVTYFSVWTQY